MPLICNIIDFCIGIIGFILTLVTLFTARSVKHQITHLRDVETFHTDRPQIVSKLEGYIASINDDHLYETDEDRTLKPRISQDLTNWLTKYTNLSSETTKRIIQSKRLLNDPSVNWLQFAESLIELRNYISKEI